MMKGLFNKETTESPKENPRVVEKKPQRLATIVDMQEPLEVFPEEQNEEQI